VLIYLFIFDALIVSDDLRAALSTCPPAADYFSAFAPSYVRTVLRWIKLAKTPTTRAKQIAEAAKLTAANAKVPQL
jgi:uncharacterized protein YdeI (YjbR/CyaY-like superfamily)